MADIKHSGRSWNPAVVAGQKLAEFVADPAHAIAGKNEAENKAALTQIHAACTEAVKPAAPAEATKEKTK